MEMRSPDNTSDYICADHCDAYRFPDKASLVSDPVSRNSSAPFPFASDQLFNHLIFFCSVIHASSHQVQLKLIRIFIKHHTSFICNTVTFILYIWKKLLRRIRIHTFIYSKSIRSLRSSSYKSGVGYAI